MIGKKIIKPHKKADNYQLQKDKILDNQKTNGPKKPIKRQNKSQKTLARVNKSRKNHLLINNREIRLLRGILCLK